MEWFAGIFVFIAVIAITAVIFGIWLLVLAVRLVVNIVFGVFSAIGRLLRVMAWPNPSNKFAPEMPCPNALCKARNPVGASYCRRCGRKLRADVERVSVRRAAAW